MTITTQAINVFSELNQWIDMVFTIDPSSNCSKAASIIDQAFNNWFDIDTDECIGDYISERLIENGIKFNMYFKEENEEN